MTVHRIRNAKIAGLQAASDHISEATQEVKQQALEYSDEFAKYVKKYPIKSVLIATACGVILGKFLL